MIYQQRVIALFGAKIAAYLERSPGITRTKAGQCRDVWDACDELYLERMPVRIDTVGQYLERKFPERTYNEGNTRIELNGWRTFHKLPE